MVATTGNSNLVWAVTEDQKEAAQCPLLVGFELSRDAFVTLTFPF